jgi:glycerol-3-phosphate cytidylyltransferase
MKRVITYGTYDLLHWGHIRLLKRAKALGDYLIVALSTDEINEFKGKKAYHSYQERKLMLESIRYVDLVIPESDWEQKRSDIANYQVDVFVIGDDWAGKFDYLSDLCEVVYLPRTEGVSTTKIKRDLEKSSKKDKKD